MQSMTGYGSGTYVHDGREVTVELKSVNHRFLDLNIRTPRGLSFVEGDIRKVIAQQITRGHIESFIRYQNTREDRCEVVVDVHLGKAYLSALQALSEDTNLSNDVTLMQLSKLPGVLETAEVQDDQDIVRQTVLVALQEAIDNLVVMREQEGEKLWQDMDKRLKKIIELVEGIKQRVPGMVEDYRTRLFARIDELMQGKVVDHDRLQMEVVLFADRSNITEEIVRLRSHIEQFRKSQEEGRKLDFIVQEMNREINTIGSKSADVEIINAVVAAKSEIEKIKEQVQNIQ